MSHQMHQNEDVEDNLLNWNDRAVVHANGADRDLNSFTGKP